MTAGDRGGAGGFTLVEVLVAIGILAVAMAIVGGTFTGTLRVQEAADRRLEVTHAARTALDRITQDLVSAFVEAEPPAGREPVGVLLEDDELDGVARDRLTFPTYGRPLGTAELASDRALVEYELVVSDDRRRWLLVRRQSSRLDPETIAEAPVDVLAEGVRGFDVKLFDGEAWKESWRDASRLPLAAEITLRIARDAEEGRPGGRSGDAQETDGRTYGTRLLLPLAERRR